MQQALTLTHSRMRCEIKPALGGCIAGLWLHDVAVLRSTPANSLTSVRDAGSFPLVPFSNRVGHGLLQWNGTRHPLVKNFLPEPHAIHGVGWMREWTVLEADEHFAMLSLDHQPDSSWPFAFAASQVCRLSAHGLESTLSMTNQSDRPAPAGLGFHPYFVKRAGARISFEANGRWEMSEENLPTHWSASTGLSVPLTGLNVDHCFDGWAGSLTLTDEFLRIRVTSDMTRLVVFTNDTKPFVAMEPVSHVNNALNLAEANPQLGQSLGITVLQPGETLSAQMTISVESLK